MALEDLTPAVRVESILNGDEITPATRLEYFLQKAATEVPKPAAGDAGKVLTVSSGGAGLEWKTPVSGKCTLTETGLAESYNDLLLMLSKGYIPYYQDSDSYLWLCTCCNYEGDGIMFRKNTDIPLNKYFIYEDSPDEPLLFD